jgi:hypothetical protein
MIFLAFAAPDNRTELWRVSGEAVTELEQMSRTKKSSVDPRGEIAAHTKTPATRYFGCAHFSRRS